MKQLDKQQLLRDIWDELGRAVHDRHHSWRTPVLATLGLDGFPDGRTVVLRGIDRDQQQLVFYTDRRTPKCEQLIQHPAATLVFWSKRLNWQCRVSVNCDVINDGDEVQSVWANVYQSKAAGDYLATTVPGSRLTMTEGNSEEATETVLNTSQPVSLNSQHYLAIVKAKVVKIDWLELNREGHRRAGIENDQVHWLMP